MQKKNTKTEKKDIGNKTLWWGVIPTLIHFTMETKNAYLIENCTGHWQNESLTFVMIDDCYAVGSDGEVYQVIDFNPVEEEDAPQANWLVYTDEQGTYFNYAEDGCISDFLKKNYGFEVDEDEDEDEIFNRLRKANYLEEFMADYIKDDVCGKSMELIDLTKDCERAISANGDGDCSIQEICNSIVSEKERELEAKGYELLGIDSDEVTDFWDTQKSRLNGMSNENSPLGVHDVSADDIALYSGATVCLYVDLGDFDYSKQYYIKK